MIGSYPIIAKCLARLLSAVEPAKGWQSWGALVPFLGIAFVASTVISLTTVLQYAGLVDDKENPIGLIGFISFLLFSFAALGIDVLGWVCLVERRPLAAIGLGGAHRTRTFLLGHLVGVAMVMAIVEGIWIAGGFHMVSPAQFKKHKKATKVVDIFVLIIWGSVRTPKFTKFNSLFENI